MKTMIFVLAVVFAVGTAQVAQATTPCVLPEAQAGGDTDLGVQCDQVDYVQYTADWVISVGVSPTPPITCNYYPGFHDLENGEWAPPHNECRIDLGVSMETLSEELSRDSLGHLYVSHAGTMWVIGSASDGPPSASRTRAIGRTRRAPANVRWSIARRAPGAMERSVPARRDGH